MFGWKRSVILGKHGINLTTHKFKRTTDKNILHFTLLHILPSNLEIELFSGKQIAS